MSDNRPTYDFVIAANRLPVDRSEGENGPEWKRSPGGLVTAMDSVMRGRDGAWVGWSGEPGEAPEPFDDAGMHLHPVALSAEEVRDYYEGFSNDTLWPIYHDVIVPATFHRRWWGAYRTVNQRFAEELAVVAAEGATVWIHDYQLQLVPAMLRQLRPDVRIGWFNHIPFPPVELFAQLPWRGHLIDGLLGADFLGFQREDDAWNFQRACRQLEGYETQGDTIRTDGRTVRAAGLPISIDFADLESLARKPEVQQRARGIRESFGDPQVLMLGVDRLDYTKGIRHRLKAYGELLGDGEFTPPDVALIQIAVPSRERVEAYKTLKDEIELTVGQINGDYSTVESTAVQYLHQSFDRAEMAAMYQAADIMLVTPLRDGMNLVAKEYVTCRIHDDGALVLSEFTGAAKELGDAYVHNPHDIEGLKNRIVQAIKDAPQERQRRMMRLRHAVRSHDVQKWAAEFLDALQSVPRDNAQKAAGA